MNNSVKIMFQCTHTSTKFDCDRKFALIRALTDQVRKNDWLAHEALI